MAGTEIRPADKLLAKRVFVDVPFRLHGADPNWAPPLRLSVYDRLSRRHPAGQHQRWALWTAHQDGKVVGRIAACIDSLFNERQGEAWAWVGFFDSVNDPEVSGSLFDVALDWSRRQGAEEAVGPANFTTNDELGLLVEGFDTPATLLTLQNPPYYEALWLASGWEQVMDLYGYAFKRLQTGLSDRQRKTLERLRERSKVYVRGMDMKDYDAEVGRFFEIYNVIWQQNWGFVPMPEAEVRHLAKQLKQVLNPRWAFALEREGVPVAVCLTLPDANQLMLKVRSGRLFPTGWVPLLFGSKKLKNVRVLALGVRQDVQNLGLGAMLYGEIVNRLWEDGVEFAEGSWTLATNTRINKQLEDMGGERYKVWRLYKKSL
jgi:GNAT superfamily N-acetyltransferase